MTQEEKAKRYDEALKVLHKYDGANIMFTQDLKEEMFPELKESDDERIRKALIKLNKVPRKEIFEAEGITKEEALAWIEKQGKQEKVFKSDEMTTLENKLSSLVVDAVHIYCKENELDTPHCVGLILGDRLAKEWSKEILESAKKELEEIESKPTDKVEPKFRIGDFIANDYCRGKVVELTNDAYLLDTGQGIPFSCEHNIHLWTIQNAMDVDKIEPKFKVGDWVTNGRYIRLIVGINSDCPYYMFKDGTSKRIKDIDKKYCLWTIQDAKGGDVLVDGLGNICIYEEPSTKLMYHSYCYGNHKCFIDSGGSHVIVGTYPATKEQRDTLMNAMAEAGYTFDFEKKELKKIEQDPACGEEDDEHLERILKELESQRQRRINIPYLDKIESDYNWLKSLKDRVQPQPKQEWSEEDEKMLKWLCRIVHHQRVGKVITLKEESELGKWMDKWLNYNPQTKQEWDEEDKNMIEAIEALCDDKIRFTEFQDVKEYAYTIKKWLKSLRPNTTWRPSEEQMKALYDSIPENVFEISEREQLLESLYQDLKKL